MSKISKAEMERVHDLFFPPEDSSEFIVKLKTSPDKLRQLTTKLATKPKGPQSNNQQPVSKPKGIKLQLATAHKIPNACRPQSDYPQPVSAAALVKVVETGITTFVEELQIQLRSQDAEIRALRTESNNQNSQLEVERNIRKWTENRKTQLEKENANLEAQSASRKRTWEDFKERMESEHGARSSIVPRKRGTMKDGYIGDLMIVNGEEFERDIQRRDERSAGAGYEFVDKNGVRYTLVAAHLRRITPIEKSSSSDDSASIIENHTSIIEDSSSSEDDD